MRSGPRESVEPVCPFCKMILDRPRDMRINEIEVVAGGTCAGCGAVYLLDPTGKNVGEVMMQGISMAAEKLSKDANSIVAGIDYEDVVLSYDYRTHRSSGEAKSYADGCGRLYVFKVNKKN